MPIAHIMVSVTRRWLPVIALVLLTSSLTCRADTLPATPTLTPPASLLNNTPSGVFQQTSALPLAQHAAWLALLHSHSTGHTYYSDVLLPGFFLAPNGAVNPEAELAATLYAITLPESDHTQTHAQCRFPARVMWLQKILDLPSDVLPNIACPRYTAWIKHGRISSLSLIFASGYFNNPASFYGHLLLKFNTGAVTAPEALLNATINYGAIVPHNESSIIYITKGLFGGYNASFSHEHYYRYNYMYGENELRDLWEYELNLTSEEVALVTAHAWELLSQQFIYYFIAGNCATRMAELLELVVQKPLLPKNRPWSIPATVFHHLHAAQHHDRPLVRTVRHLPSRQNVYYAQYNKLNIEQKNVARQLTLHSLDWSMPAFTVLSPTAQVGVVDTLLSYYEYVRLNDDGHADTDAIRHKLLSARTQLPPTPQSSVINDHAAAPPHLAPPPSLMRAAWTYNNQRGSGSIFTVRPAYYDLLDIEQGRPTLSQLVMGELSVEWLNDRLQFRHFNLVHVETLTPSPTQLPGDARWSWMFDLSYGRDNLACESCNVANMTGGAGKTIALGRQIFAYGMLDLRAQSNYDEPNFLLAYAPRFGLIASPTAAWRAHLALSRRSFVDHSRTDYAIYRFENRFGLNPRWDVRLAYTFDVAHEVSAAISTRW